MIRGSQAPLAFVGCVDCLATQNTIVDPGHWILRILQETTTSGGYAFAEAQNGTLSNNLVYFERGLLSTYTNVGPSTQGATFHFENNLWYAHDDAAQSTPTDLPAAEQNSVSGVDPALADPSADDYVIGASSPAAGAGKSGQDSLGDIQGACWKDPPSIGAYEVP